MKYYERCKVTVAIPVAGEFDEAVIRQALTEHLPGIEVSFRPVSSTEVLEVGEVFVPPDHPIAGAAEQDPNTKKVDLSRCSHDFRWGERGFKPHQRTEDLTQSAPFLTAVDLHAHI
jgi:hypothetical protein